MSKQTALKRLISEKGYTVQQFADIAGISKRTLDPYVAGAKKFNKTQLWLAVKIADALNVNVHTLMEDE